MAKRRLEALAANDFADWRDARLTQVKPATVAREMNLMRSVLEVARRDWKWIRVNPMTDVRWPKCPKGRARRIDVETVQALAEAFGVRSDARRVGKESVSTCRSRWSTSH